MGGSKICHVELHCKCESTVEGSKVSDADFQKVKIAWQNPAAYAGKHFLCELRGEQKLIRFQVSFEYREAIDPMGLSVDRYVTSHITRNALISGTIKIIKLWRAGPHCWIWPDPDGEEPEHTHGALLNSQKRMRPEAL